MARPSPAIAFAAAVLALAVAATAVAGPDALTRAVTKPKVKQIARKQADRRITSRAPELSVASAATAQSANPAAFAHVAANGAVIAADSKNIEPANVAPGSVGGYYCFRDLPFEVRGASANLDWNSTPLDLLVSIGFGDADGTCPPATELFVDTRMPDGTGSAPGGFFIALYG
jgi:hypothetical protein